MNHVRLYRNELTHLGYGNPVWEPNPDTLYDRIRIGDVGYFQNDQFIPLFNILPPDNSNRICQLPFPQPNFQCLDLPEHYPTTHRRNPLQAGVYALESSLTFSASVGVDSAGSVLHGESSLSFTNEKGAALILPSEALREDTLYEKLFKQHMLKYYRQWYTFALTECQRDIKLCDLVLVTGCDLTRQWATATYFRSNREISAAVGAQVAPVAEAKFSLTAGWSTTQAMNTRRGPPQALHQQSRHDNDEVQSDSDTLVNNQCIFLRGFYVKDRLWGPQVMKAGAGYHDPGKYGPEEEGEGVLADDDVTVESLSPSTQGESFMSVLLDYMLEESDADIVIANDSDLWPYLGEASNPETLRDTLKRISPLIKVENRVGSLVRQDDEANPFPRNVFHSCQVDEDGIDIDDLSCDRFLTDDDSDDEFLTISALEEEEEPEEAPSPYYPGLDICIVCQKRPPYSRGGKSYPTCGLACAKTLDMALNQNSSGPSPPSGGSHLTGYGSRGRGASSRQPPQTSSIRHLAQNLGGFTTPQQQRNRKGTHAGTSRPDLPALVSMTTDPCVVCLVKPRRGSGYVTCGLKCAEKLCTTGGANTDLCDYCHRHAKIAGQNQCSDACKASARLACLVCKSRPKHKGNDLCGKTCKEIAIKQTPLILEVPKGHVTYEMVEKKFTNSWKSPNTRIPIIQRIYKIIENKEFLEPYDKYKKAVGNEVFRYHGTTRKCTLGTPGNTKLCNAITCALCSILRTSFKIALGNPTGAFGPGVYSSSASNKAYSYTASGAGAMLLTKVVLGKVRQVNRWNEVMSCPPGFNSVVFDRQNGCLNETVVYSDDAIRPVFLIMF